MACDLATLPEMRVPSSMTLDEIDQFLAPSHFSVGLDDDDLTLMKHLTDYNKRAANNFSPPDVESVLQTQTINPALLDLSRNESSPDGLLQSGMGSPAAPDIADVPQMTTSPTGPAFLSSSNDPFFGSSSPSPSSPGTPCPTPSLIRQGRLHTRSPEVQQVQQQEAMHYAKSKQNTDRLQPACMPPPAIPASSMSQNPQMHHVGRLPTSPSPTNPEMWIHAAGDQFPMGYPPRVPAPGLLSQGAPQQGNNRVLPDWMLLPPPQMIPVPRMPSGQINSSAMPHTQMQHNQVLPQVSYVPMRMQPIAGHPGLIQLVPLQPAEVHAIRQAQLLAMRKARSFPQPQALQALDQDPLAPLSPGRVQKPQAMAPTQLRTAMSPPCPGSPPVRFPPQIAPENPNLSHQERLRQGQHVFHACPGETSRVRRSACQGISSPKSFGWVGTTPSNFYANPNNHGRWYIDEGGQKHYLNAGTRNSRAR